jgi:hypothetical protein
MKIWLIAGVAGAALLATGCTTAHNSASGPKPLSAVATVHQAALDSQTLSSEDATANLTVKFDGSTNVMSGSLQVQNKPSLFINADFAKISGGSETIPGGMREIVTPSAVYLRASELSSETGKEWTEIPFSELGGTKDADLGQMIQQAQNSDPASEARYLTGATGVRRVGTSVIGGTAVTEYTGTVSLTEALSKFSSSVRAQLREQIEQMGITDASFKVWIDGQYRVRELVISETGTDSSLSMTMTATSFNQPVDTTLPSASQTATLPADGF